MEVGNQHYCKEHKPDVPKAGAEGLKGVVELRNLIPRSKILLKMNEIFMFETYYQ